MHKTHMFRVLGHLLGQRGGECVQVILAAAATSINIEIAGAHEQNAKPAPIKSPG